MSSLVVLVGFEAVGEIVELPRHEIRPQIDVRSLLTVADPPFILHLAVALHSAALGDDDVVAIAAGGARHIVDGIFHPGTGMTANDVEIIARPQIVLRESLGGHLHGPEANRGTPPQRSRMLTDGAVIIQFQNFALVLDANRDALGRFDSLPLLDIRSSSGCTSLWHSIAIPCSLDFTNGTPRCHVANKSAAIVRLRACRRCGARRKRSASRHGRGGGRSRRRSSRLLRQEDAT